MVAAREADDLVRAHLLRFAVGAGALPQFYVLDTP